MKIEQKVAVYNFSEIECSIASALLEGWLVKCMAGNPQGPVNYGKIVVIYEREVLTSNTKTLIKEGEVTHVVITGK